MTTRYYVPISSAEFAKLFGVSGRTARRQIAQYPGAIQSTGNRWLAPVPAAQYARLTGVSYKTARRRAITLSDLDARKGTLKQRAAGHLVSLLVGVGTKKPVAPTTVENRLGHATRPQLLKVLNIDPLDIPGLISGDMFDDAWEGDDGLSIFLYH